jgi:hypothetical protein
LHLSVHLFLDSHPRVPDFFDEEASVRSLFPIQAPHLVFTPSPLNQNNLESTTSNIFRSSGEKVFICADIKPSREHERKFNAPTTSEVGLILVGEDFPSRNIVIQDKEDRLQFINEWNSISIGFSEG